MTFKAPAPATPAPATTPATSPAVSTPDQLKCVSDFIKMRSIARNPDADVTACFAKAGVNSNDL